MIVLILMLCLLCSPAHAEIRENHGYVSYLAMTKTRGCETFEEIVTALRIYSHEKIRPKEGTGIEPYMSMSIADRIDCGIGWCNHSVAVLMALLEKKGIKARMVYLLNDDQTSSPHTVAEVFDTRNNKWIICDPAYNLELKLSDGSFASIADLKADPSILLNEPFVQARKKIYDTIEEWEAWVRIYTNQNMIVYYNQV